MTVDTLHDQRADMAAMLLETTSEAFHSPEVVEAVGADIAATLHDQLTRLVIAEVDGSVIHVPDDTPDDAILFLPMVRTERLKLSVQFLGQTPAQKEAAYKTFGEWQPLGKSAEEQIEITQEFMTSRKHQLPFYLPAGTAAYMDNNAATIAVDKKAFVNAPEGFAVLCARPLLGIVMDDRIKPEAVGHELAHAEQRDRKSIHTFDSQEAIDLDFLEQELEGYNRGATIQVAMNGGVMPRLPYKIKPADAPVLLQLAVEQIRARHNKGQQNPYRATPQIARDIKRTLGISIIHHNLKYDDIMADIRRYARFDV